MFVMSSIYRCFTWVPKWQIRT